MTNNTELFERILSEKLPEYGQSIDVIQNPDKYDPRDVYRANIFVGNVNKLKECMQELSEFYRWCGNRCLYNYSVGSWVVVNTAHKKTELELFDIWKAEKGGNT